MAFSYYKTLTTDHTQAGTANSSNYVFPIFITDTDLKSVANGGFVQSSSGYDIRPYADSLLTVPLAFDLVAYTDTTGRLIMWVQIPTLDHISDQIYYLAFGNASLTTDGSSSSTWDSGFQGVYHLENSPNSGKDSGQGGHPITLQGTAFINTDVVGFGLYALGPGLQGYATGSLDATAWTVGATVSGWVQLNDNSTQAGLFQWAASSSPNSTSPGWLWQNNSGTLRMYNGTGDVYILSGYTLSNTTRYHIAQVWTGDHFHEQFVQGVSQGVYDAGANVSFLAARGSAVYIANGFSADVNGQFDEWRVSNVARSSSWLTADYNSQKPSSTFLSWGTKTPLGGGPGNSFVFFTPPTIVYYRRSSRQ